ncbi:hypothetical protein [Lentzea sp. NPDC051838]|uniref:hypothetical protein n=1 Tax=Lentzea sp. NPDC051838 TaxID=3154849 RepID=UPI00344198CB
MRGPTVVKAITAIFAITALIAGFLNLVRHTDDDRTNFAVHRSLDKHRYDGPVPALRVILKATGLNSTERKLQASLTLTPPRYGEVLELVDKSGDSIVQGSSVKPEFADAKVTIAIINRTFGTDTSVSFPLDAVVKPYPPAEIRKADVSILAAVDPTRFPNDIYYLDLSVDAYLPPGVHTTVRKNAPTGDAAGLPDTDALPIAFGIELDYRLRQWALTTDKIIAGSLEGGPATHWPRRFYAAEMKAEFGRDWTYWAFIYAVSLMPAMIGLSFVVRTRHRRMTGSDDTSAAMELAAALLALIALRQVFVPTDTVGLTTLDLVLGAQLLVVCWLMAVTYVSEPRPARQKPKPRPRKQRPIPKLPDGAIK